MDNSAPSVPELAAELGVSAKTMRAWMRRQGWRHPVEKGAGWMLTPERVTLLRARFSAASDTGIVPSDTVAAPDTDEFASLTVGELLGSYSRVLAELRTRNLVRTNNAPIGDLAEYCAATVYDGLLAPNSEKSYDLIASDGAKVQVKVRLIRPATSPSAVFSPIRSFGFDVCVFILIDNDRGEVITAREWTAGDVRQHGRHREHTNGVVVRMGQVRGSSTIGNDRTGDFDETWQQILTQRR